MKVLLKKLLKSWSAHYILSTDEPIIGLLPSIEKEPRYIPLTVWAVEQGFVTMKPSGKYNQYFFTEKGLKEFAAEYCISGKKIG